MKILSIETSCDDTAISIMGVTGGMTNASFKVLANVSNSQINIHIPYGGVYPVLAKREHAKNLPILLEQTLKQAKLSTVDVVAVTYGPGLEMCLWEGITFAQNLAKKWSAGRRSAIPVIPVNHMEGHIFSPFGKNKGRFKIPKVAFPMLSLLVSGGHTQLVLSKKWMQYEIIGETLDDAVGEAFDKVARMLGLPYPGGPEISRLAEEERARGKEYLRGHLKELENFSGPQISGSLPRPDHSKSSNSSYAQIILPRPMLHSKNFNFSFSGLKTAVLYLIHNLEKKHSNILQNDKIKTQIALEFENAAIECLVSKTKKAVEKYKIKTLIVAGGVACNKHLQREMQKITTLDPSSTRRGGYKKIKLLFPTKELATDNSLMIGIAGYLNYIKNKKKVPKPESIKATGNLRL